MIYVLDASFALSWALSEPHSNKAIDYIKEISKSKLLVPNFWIAEISNGLYRSIRESRISQLESRLFIYTFKKFKIFVSEMPSIFTLLNFSLTNKISAFDASYILLAIDNGATLLTNDLQMKRIAENHNVKVIGAEKPDF